jgi:hypothetical protein
MLDGETLYDKEGERYWYQDGSFFWDDEAQNPSRRSVLADIPYYRSPQKRTREMTQNEALSWAKSKASWGWMVRTRKDEKTWGGWHFPSAFTYDFESCQYQRARLLPDLSDIDESTIQGFEVEE